MDPWDDICNMIREGFTASCNRIRYQNGLIHEHEFVPRRLKGSNHLAGNVTVICVGDYWKRIQ
jgi:hypothetical protein